MCKILVVEDKPDVLATLTGLLTDYGYAVNSAANEGSALATALEEEPDFAVIDVRLHSEDAEDESGLSLSLALKKVIPKIRIVLITGGKIKARRVARAVQYQGVIDFIEKGPDAVTQIIEAIELARKEPQRTEIAGTPGETRLNVSLISGQPLFLRAHGHYVRSVHTRTILHIDAERYARRTELARKNVADMRFQVEDIGNRLWEEVFSLHREAVEVYAAAKSSPLTLVFETTRELVRLPLEFMRSTSPQEYLVLQHPISRVVFDASPKREALSPRLLSKPKKLRILLIASNTEPAIPGVEAEVQALATFLNQQKPSITVTTLLTSQASYERVQDELRKDYDVIHYAGHGFFDPVSPEDSFLLFWENGSQQTALRQMKASEFKLLLEQSEARLVYLSCCYGTATASPVALLDDDFLGLADAVVEAGVPTVLGFRWPVSDDGARRLALAFYRSLLKDGRPDVALWRARRELAVDRNEPTWLSPILIHQE